MSRSEKLYRRLDLLEAEYCALVGLELQKKLDTGYSPVISHTSHPRLISKSWQTDDERHILWLSKEIEMLRDKLGEPNETSPATKFQKLAARVAAQHNSAIAPSLIKEVLDQWKSVEIADSEITR